VNGKNLENGDVSKTLCAEFLFMLKQLCAVLGLIYAREWRITKPLDKDVKALPMKEPTKKNIGNDTFFHQDADIFAEFVSIFKKLQESMDTHEFGLNPASLSYAKRAKELFQGIGLCHRPDRSKLHRPSEDVIKNAAL
jgi:hypothetical protein